TSMIRFQEVLDNIFIGNKSEEEIYNRIFVVSAYAGITDQLLEHKRSHKPGVYSEFCDTDSDWAWADVLSETADTMCQINKALFTDEMDLQIADRFVLDRIEGVRSCLLDLQRLCSYGHFQLEEHLATVREMLSALGEAHSAHNTSLILYRHGINARFIDLTGWREKDNPGLDEKILKNLEGIDFSKELPIVTGYTQCQEGLMSTFDRGYTEITFSRIAVLTQAREAIIHKEYHLSTADPRVVGEERVIPIGRTNYDVADQLSNLGMEAIHPKAAKGLRQSDIPLRVRNAFEPNHNGTLICNEYCSEQPCVEIIAGMTKVYAIEVFDQDMVGVSCGYESNILSTLMDNKFKIVTKDINANTITHYVSGSLKKIKRLIGRLQHKLPNAEINMRKVAVVSAIGSDMQVPGILAATVSLLASDGVSILAMHQSMRQVDMQFIIAEDDYEKAVKALHKGLIERGLGIIETDPQNNKSFSICD
ncbi:MAG: aspartate kinase, partial [Gammaproteobacteria bacterium]